MTRTLLAAVAACLVVVGGIAAALYAYNRPTELRVAVAQSAQDFRLMTAAAQTFAHQREEVRLKVVPVADAAAAAAALEHGSSDLAVVRSDALPPAARALVVLHRNAALLIAPGGTRLKRIADLRGKKVAVVQEVPGAQSNARLLETILDQYDIPRQSVTTTVVAPGGVEDALRARAVEAIFLVALPQFGVASEVVAKIAAAGNGKPPVFLPIAEAKAIAKRVPTLETTEVLRGALGGDPPRPAESLETPSVAVLLVGRPIIAASVAGELTRELLVHRAALAALAPLANYMEAPSTDKDSAVPAHQGTIDFIDGDEHGFFDKYSDFLYLGAMLTSLVGSAAAALASRLRISTQLRSERLIERLLEILPAARAAPNAAELDDYERELDQAIVDAMADVRLRKMAPSELHMVSLALDQARLAIQERRRALGETRGEVAEVTPLRSLREVRAGE
ncbi:MULTISPECIES: TAXI family TRAP transporter solute-binding subunit [Methylosinus]|uniref:C4-dicarboxylate ABC transporter substrate-binding protein n=1 Tax=Methylosinus trichosporium (strain ATCC 35070 / NCIMB 11131 / UNIQEM 75 / OB3b) TaxID=595536 RepID=A0A2D2D2Q9_METT3|nr:MULTISPECIES: TAXI family TRAP transporter solute-binding subunit [Methylosinus]ATQ69149.1 C4-dicarboxylate ABC transporter substrate-binding protein [Methylosinus trichosporium OB3b]OBS53573.1 C4-dicarboxylate ABC transporter substrate-binding protein [Methylosinus sp. 3S-1]